MRRILIYMGHPAHFHLFKNLIKKTKKHGIEVLVIVKKKDILEELLQKTDIAYVNILTEGKKNNGKLSLGWSLLKRYYRMWKKIRRFKPDCMLGTSAEIAHLGSILNIPSYVFEEDDWDVIPLFSKSVYPFATKLIAPVNCRMGKWESKTIRHDSYHELAYLHPDIFTPSKELIKSFHTSDEPYFILRFVELSAFHDEGVEGLTNKKAFRLIGILENYGNVYISSERKLNRELEKYRISIDPIHIHHALSFAKMFIGDSQTMAAESMVLGTPSIRYNDFVGRISYLEELEQKYQLGFGFGTTQFESLLQQVNSLLECTDLENEWNDKRKKMLDEKIDFTKFMLDLINPRTTTNKL